MSNLTKRGKPRKRVGRGASVRERIDLHTEQNADGCWIWTAALKNGYGAISLDGKIRFAHRVAYEDFVGPIPDGLQLDHLCRVPACVNPLHLEAVTPQTNVLRGYSPGAVALRRENCLYGHPYSEHGVIASGRRICGLCRKTYMRLRKQVPYAEAMRRKREGLPVVDLAAYFADQTQERAA